MTDLEISKALALAIGWKQTWTTRATDGEETVTICISPEDAPQEHWELFDYRDWTVSAPIAEKFNVFPYKADEKLYGGGWLTMHASRSYETPQKAIAMAVIGGEL